VLAYQLQYYSSRGKSASSSSCPPFSPASCRRCADLLTKAIRNALLPSEPSEDGCELLYGRAGLLYAMLFLRQYRTTSSLSLQNDTHSPEASSIRVLLRPLTSSTTLQRLVNDIIRRGVEGATRLASELEAEESQQGLMWSWHGKRYLGSAHGVGQ
jgi:Lanthionine synthetase C-like protein